MANVLGTSSLTYTGKETMDVLLKPSFEDPELNKVFRIMTDIQSKQKLYLLNPLAYITKKYDSCGLPATTGGPVNITQKTLEVEPLQIYLEQCADVFNDTIFEQWRRTGKDWNDLTGTEAQKLIETVVMDAVKRDAFRIANFGNTSLSDTRYTMLDGKWTKIFQNVDSYCIDRVEYLPDGTLGADAALGYLKNLYNNADNILKQVPNANKQFEVTGSIYDNLLASYESKTSGTAEMQFNWLVDGVASLKFRGIEVVPIRSWDTYIAADFSNSNPHRIIYTAKDNWVLGVEKQTDFTTAKFWYSDDDDKNKVLIRYRMGVEFVHCDLTAVSY
ncbi:MAG: hypothetical protein K2X97_07055 [Mycobacteriaceae bacterium]|nr:hypothetical protein [Mycobacteriaceae bacterium]